ncbi:hypothetical protein [Pseudanabaena minima]|uniref:hypothetical protein n=1 Tax=Pseudanabaena minima TaxID=890415 RepID=UPI003DA9DD5F
MTSIATEKSVTSQETKQPLTLEEFLRLPDIDASYELEDAPCPVLPELVTEARR